MHLIKQKLLILLFFCWLSSWTQIFGQDSSLINELKQHVSFLASDSLKGRFAGTHEGHIAASYIALQMKGAGLKSVSGFSNFFNPFLYKKDTLLNVIGAIAGSSLVNEVIIFSAHYDHVGTRSINPYPDRTAFSTDRKDSIYNGANDDASGIASLLALANLIKKDSIQPLRTIVFIAFDGEELGEIGSNLLVNDFDAKKVYAVINLEMLGIPSYGKPFITGDEFSNLRTVLNETLYSTNATQYGKDYFEREAERSENLFLRSDNFPFANKKIIAHTIMATSAQNEYYHSVKDEPSTLDYPFMASAIQAIHTSVLPLLVEDVKLKGKGYLAK